MPTECLVKLNEIIGSPYCSTPWLFNSACVHAKWLQSCLTGTAWTVACQAPLSRGFSRQEYWSGLPFSKGIFPTQGSNPHLFMSPELFTTHGTWETQLNSVVNIKKKGSLVQIHFTTKQIFLSFQCVCVLSVFHGFR